MPWPGGPSGGREILSDSNLDWGQGLKPLVRLQQERPEFRDLTLYYFGDTEPARLRRRRAALIRVRATSHNSRSRLTLSAETTYLAVSASLRWGPWAPAGYFRDSSPLEPVRFTDDTTIAIYRTADLTSRASIPKQHDPQTVMTQ